MQNLEGVLLGEATTAARDTAVPCVGAGVLARWASEQAALIAETVDDEERQARCAEVVLERGGDIGALKIVRWGPEDWLNAAELEERPRSSLEFVVTFDGEFEYHEGRDDVPSRHFHLSFEHADSGSRPSGDPLGDQATQATQLVHILIGERVAAHLDQESVPLL
jgi:hypothetical protein